MYFSFTMEYIIGIDDTDNKESRGTGFHARRMAHLLEKQELAFVKGITRHQLFLHPDIPYTSQNSSAAILLSTSNICKCLNACKEFLTSIAPAGSDIGIACIQKDSHYNNLEKWGYNAKSEILTQKAALQLANRENIFLEGLTGSKDGIIGALAATGLRKSGDDGRFIWLKGIKELREFPEGIYSLSGLIDQTGIDGYHEINNPKTEINLESRIILNNWIRPVLKGNKVILLLEKVNDPDTYEWKNASKDLVRAVS